MAYNTGVELAYYYVYSTEKTFFPRRNISLLHHDYKDIITKILWVKRQFPFTTH